MTDFVEAILEFKNQKGSNASPANSLLLEFIEDKTTTRGFSHNMLRTRLSFVQQGAESYFLKNDIPAMNLKPLDNGYENLVMDCNNGYVLKIRRGKPYRPFKTAAVLQPVTSGYCKDTDMNYSIFPKIDDHKSVSAFDVVATTLKTALKGFIIHDPVRFNFGSRQDKKSKTRDVMLLDYGAIREGKGMAYNLMYCGFALGRFAFHSLYMNMPFIHPHWRRFKANVKTMLGETAERRNNEQFALNPPIGKEDYVP